MAEKKQVKSKAKKAKAEKKPAPKKVKKTSSKKEEISLKDLLEAGCHFGHKRSKTHPKAKKYIFTIRDGIAVFDLAKTKEKLEEAKKFISDLIKKEKKIVFLGTKRQAREIVREEAKRVAMPYVVNRWLGGTITNWEEIKKNSIDKLNQLKKDWQEDKFKKRTKKEQALIRREINRLDQLVGGLSNLDKLFEALFIVDIGAEETAVKEARMKGIAIVAITDSNVDPNLVDYPIPANDDAARSIQLLVREIGKAIRDDSKNN